MLLGITLTVLVGAASVAAFNDERDSCSAWPTANLRCPQFCHSHRNRSEHFSTLCHADCPDGQLLFQDGICRTAAAGCPGSGIVTDPLGVSSCVTDTIPYPNPCDLAIPDEYLACPPQPEFEVTNWSWSADFNPPQAETMRACSAQFEHSRELNVLTGETFVEYGYLQPPRPDLGAHHTYRVWWAFVALYVLGAVSLIAWTIFRWTSNWRLRRSMESHVHQLLKMSTQDELVPGGGESASLDGSKKGADRMSTEEDLEARRYMREDTLGAVQGGILLPAHFMSQTGKSRSACGTIVYYILMACICAQPLRLVLYIMDAYGMFGMTFCREATMECFDDPNQVHYTWRQGWTCGAHCLLPEDWSTGVNVFWPYERHRFGGKIYLLEFLKIWLLGVALIALLLILNRRLRRFFRVNAPLDKARYVEVEVPGRTKIRVDPAKGGCIESLTNRCDAWFDRMTNQRTYYGLCPVICDKTGTRYFEFRSQRYIWSASQAQFVRAEISLGSDCVTLINNISLTKGLTESEAQRRTALVGPNRVAIPILSLSESILEEIKRFDFVYQMFCLSAWFIFYYSLAATFVLAMIFGSSTLRMINKRSNQRRLRELAIPPKDVSVIRNGVATLLPAQHITVGDVIPISDLAEIPADMVMLRGSCVANEATLTGEPNPVPKAPLQPFTRSYQPRGADVKSTLFAGTTITSSSDDCLCVVAAVGAHSTRGHILSQILEPTTIRFKFDLHWKIIFPILMLWGLVNVVIGVWFIDWELEGWFYGIFTISQVLSPLIPAVFVAGQAVVTRRLKKLKIYCTSLQRTLVAGKVKTVCFDKTGTLTESGVSMRATLPYLPHQAHFEAPLESFLDQNQRSRYSELYWALSTCHEVQTRPDGSLIGADVDVGMFEWTGATLRQHQGGREITSFDHLETRTVVRVFEFQRESMTSSVLTQQTPSGSFLAFTKGSWESIRERCRHDVPVSLDEEVRKWSAQGFYVLAIASRELAPNSSTVDRKLCEEELNLLGLVVFANQLLPDTASVIADIKAGDCRCVMITGDNPLTASKVASDCGIIDESRSVVIIDARPDRTELNIYRADDPEATTASVPLLIDEITKDPHWLTVTGPALTLLSQLPTLTSFHDDVLSRCRVFSRMTPMQKESIVSFFMTKGVTAMVGDGANDAAAMERAHCGIAVRTGDPSASRDAASVAHYAAEANSIRTVEHVLRHGRCGLTSTITAYKNLIIYGEIMVMLSFIEMYLHVVPPEAYWILVDAIVNSGMTWAILRSRPAKKLAAARPSSSLLGGEILFSTGFQIFANWVWMLVIMSALWAQPWFSCRRFDSAHVDHANWWEKGDNYEAVTLGLVGTFQWITVAPSLNFGGLFRRAWLRNWEVPLLWVIFCAVGSILIWTTGNGFVCLFRTNCGDATVLNFWHEEAVTRFASISTTVTPSILIPAGCPCNLSQNNPLCENEYPPVGYMDKLRDCNMDRFHSPVHHNVFPQDWRWILTGLLVANVLTCFLLERFVVGGPIGQLFRRKKYAKESNTSLLRNGSSSEVEF